MNINIVKIGKSSSKKILPCLALGFVVGCVPALKIKPENQNVVVSYASDFDTSRVASKSKMVVRAYRTENKKKIEVDNAQCNLSSQELHANFSAPAVLYLPKFVQNGKYEARGRPSHVRIECSGDGLSGVDSITASNKQVSTATNAGLAGAILTTVVTAALAATLPWHFPQTVSINMDSYQTTAVTNILPQEN